MRRLWSFAGTFGRGLTAANGGSRACRRHCAAELSAAAGLSAAVFLALGANAARAEGRVGFDTEIAYTYDDNVTRAARDSDIRDDRIAGLTLGVNWRHTSAKHFRLALRGFAQGEQFTEHEGLSNAGGGISGSLKYRGSGALLAPTFAIFGKITSLNYDSDLRDSEFYQAGASVQKGLTDRMDFTGVLAHTTRDSDSRVFDTRETSLLINLDFRWAQRLTQYLSYNFVSGDIVASGTPTWLTLINYAEEIQADDAFGGASANMFSYRLNAQTHVATLGFNIAINEQQSIDLSARYARAEADGDITYDRNIVSAAYLLRF